MVVTAQGLSEEEFPAQHPGAALMRMAVEVDLSQAQTGALPGRPRFADSSDLEAALAEMAQVGLQQLRRVRGHWEVGRGCRKPPYNPHFSFFSFPSAPFLPRFLLAGH